MGTSDKLTVAIIPLSTMMRQQIFAKNCARITLSIERSFAQNTLEAKTLSWLVGVVVSIIFFRLSTRYVKSTTSVLH